MSKIYKNVKIGENAKIGEFVVIGVPPRGKEDGELETVIGKNAVIRSHSVIYAGNKIGDNFNTGHGIMMREENEIGNNVSVGTHSALEHHIIMEDGARIHTDVFIPEFSVLKKNAWVGPKVTVTNAKYPLSIGVKERLQGPIIEEGAIVGANVTILPEVVIGKNSLVGAGSVVSKDVPPGKVVTGNPAKVVKDRSEIPVYRE